MLFLEGMQEGFPSKMVFKQKDTDNQNVAVQLVREVRCQQTDLKQEETTGLRVSKQCKGYSMCRRAECGRCIEDD